MEAYAAQGAPYGFTILIAGTAFGVLFSLLLWYFVSRRASRIAKWILAVLFTIGLISLIVGLAGGRSPVGPQFALGLVAMLIQGASIWMLFRPDAVAWFAGRGHHADIFR